MGQQCCQASCFGNSDVGLQLDLNDVQNTEDLNQILDEQRPVDPKGSDTNLEEDHFQMHLRVQMPRRSTRIKFDYCSYEKFVLDEDFKDVDATDQEYSKQFVLKPSNDGLEDEFVKMQVQGQGAQLKIEWDMPECLNKAGLAMNQFEPQW